MGGFLQDIRFGVASIYRRPGLSAAVLGSLILGIGLNTAVFSLLAAVFEQPLPVREPEKLVRIFQSLRNDGGEYLGERAFSHATFLDLERRARGFDGLALYHIWPVNLSGGNEPLRGTGVFVTPSYFDVLGLAPAEGRLWTPDDSGEKPEAVLSHGCWKRVFGSDPSIVGRDVMVNGETLTVIGVAPPGFHGTELEQRADVFLPLLSFQRLSPYRAYFELRSVGIFHGLARLAEGNSPELANEEAVRVGLELAAEYPKDLDGSRLGAVPLIEGSLAAGARERHRAYAKVLAGAAAVLLLIACLNVSSLLLVRGIERGREIALREALGAGRASLLRLLVVENLVFLVLGALLSLPAALLFLRLLWLFRPPQFAADALALGIHGEAFLWTLGVAFAAVLAFGLWPLIRASRPELAGALKSGGRVENANGRTTRKLIVVFQVSMTLVALVAAGLFLRALQATATIDLGFETDEILVASLSPGEQGYDEPLTRDYYDRLLQRAQALPGVASAALSESRLLRGARMQRQIFVDGQPEALEIHGRTTHRVNIVSHGFFEAAGISLRSGRDFFPDEPGALAAVINETMAEQIWPEGNAVGQVFHFDFPEEPPVRVVGIAADARYRQIREDPQFFVYLPLAQNFTSAMVLHVRTEGDPAALAPTLRRVAQEIDPTLPVEVAPLRQYVDEALWQERTAAVFLAAYGLLAWVLAILGVYGLLAWSVERQRRDLGIRMALGARRIDILGGVLGEACRLAALGLAVGIPSAFFLLRPVVESRLVGVQATAPLPYAVAAIVLLAVALAGGAIPALRASQTDPALTLRNE